MILDLVFPIFRATNSSGGYARETKVFRLWCSKPGDEAGKVQALDLGADDYVTKPFGMEELWR